MRAEKQQGAAMSDVQERVGYGKPPKHTQFKKGQSGNPKGRPKTVDKEPRHTLALLEKHQMQKVSIIENGKQKIVSKQEAVIMQLLNHAMAGNLRALQAYIRICLQAEDKGLHFLPKGVTKADIDSAARMRKMSDSELNDLINDEVARMNRETPVTFDQLKTCFNGLIEQGMSVQDVIKNLGISGALEKPAAGIIENSLNSTKVTDK